MAADVGGRDGLAERHRLQRLERRHDLRHARGQSRVHHEVRESVIVVHAIVWDPSREDDAVLHAEPRRLRLQRLLFGPAADEQDAKLRKGRGHALESVEQQREAFVAIPGADEAQDRSVSDAESRGQGGIARGLVREVLRVHGVAHDRHLVGRYATRDDVGAQSFAYGRHGSGSTQRVGLEAAARAITQAAGAVRAVSDRAVFPQGAHLVHEWNPASRRDRQRGERHEAGRVRVDDVGAALLRHLRQSRAQLGHDGELVDHGHPVRQLECARRAVERQAVDLLDRRFTHVVARGGELPGFEAERALLLEDRLAAEGIAAVQGDRVIEYVQYAYGSRHGNVGVRCERALVPDFA